MTNLLALVAISASLNFDSRYLSYGFVDNYDPIVTPSAEIAFGEIVTVGADAIFDVTKYGRRAGYGNREWKYTELHPWASIGYVFSSDDYEWLPTTVHLSLSYLYEYHPSAKARHGERDPGADDDSQFWTVEICLPELVFEPVLQIERDVMRDNGTYVNLEIGHSFELTDSLCLHPTIAQGFGNAPRMRGYTDLDHAGLMDTLAKVELCWHVTDALSLAGYVGWSDFLFDRRIRHAAREYDAAGRWDESWNFIYGFSLSLSF